MKSSRQNDFADSRVETTRKDWQDHASTAEKFLLAEASARAKLLLICSEAIGSSRLEASALLPPNHDARLAMLSTLHQLQRRLETDRALVEAAMARWTLETEDHHYGAGRENLQ